MLLKALIYTIASFSLCSFQSVAEINPTLKVTYLDGSDASGHYTQSLIEDTQTIMTTINEAGDYLIDGSSATKINEKIYIGPNYEGTLKLKNVNIFYSGSNMKVGAPIDIDPAAKVTMLLSGDNVISAPQYFPAIGIYGSEPKDGYLIIDSQDGGNLNASTMGSGAAAIGGRGYTREEIYVSDITIKGGNLNVKTIGTGGSGIGTGENGQIGTISIEGGHLDVYAHGYKGSGSGAAIGSGSQGKVDNIQISGGTIKAYTAKDGRLESNAAAIGCGSFGKVKNITITGGKIEAISSLGSAIGSGITYLEKNDMESLAIQGGLIKTQNLIEGEPSLIGVSKNATNSLKSFTIGGGSIFSESFNPIPTNKDQKTLYPLNLSWDQSPISSIYIDNQNMNISDPTGGEDSLTFYVEGKDATLKVDTPEKQRTYQATFNSGSNSFEVKEEGVESIPSTPLNKVPQITTIEKKVPQFSTFDDTAALEGITAYDEEDGPLTQQIQVLDNPVDTSVVGDYYVTYYVEDNNHASTTAKAKVSVYAVEQPHTPPVITAEDLYFEYKETYDERKVLANAKAHDENNVDISDRIQVKEQNVDTSHPGQYKIVYQVTDDNDLTTTLEIKAIVKEPVTTNTPPTLNGEDFTILLNEHLSDAQIKEKAKVQAYDEEEQDITDRIIIAVNEIDYEHVGDYKVIFQVTDSDNNMVQKQITVSVIKNPDTDNPDTSHPDTDKPDTDKPDTDKPTPEEPKIHPLVLGLSIAGGFIAAVLIGTGIFFLVKKNKEK